MSELNVRRLIEILKKLDIAIVKEISSSLLQNPITCLPSVFVHLLSGNPSAAADLLVKLCVSDTSAADDSQGNMEAASGSSLLIDTFWDIAMKFVFKIP